LGVKSEPLRKALREYLLSESDLARREDRVREVAAGEGRIVLAHPESISLLLVPEADGDPVRVVWKSEQGKEVRTIAAGTYRVQHYAMTRRDRQDVEWQLWASGSKGRIVKIEEGADPLTLRLDPRIHLRTTARWADRGLRVGIAPTGDRGMGVTIMRDGKRIPAKYRVLGSEGITAKGAMAYG